MKIVKKTLMKTKRVRKKSKWQTTEGATSVGEMEVQSAGHGALTFKLFGHEQHWEVLIDTSQPAAVDLEKLQGFRLEELLKYHSIVALEIELK